MENEKRLYEEIEKEEKNPKVRNCWSCGTNVVKQEEHLEPTKHVGVYNNIITYKCPICGLVYTVRPS